MLLSPVTDDSNISGSSQATAGLRIAVIEGQDLEKSKFQNKSPAQYSNRCSSLTPKSIRYLRGMAWPIFSAEISD
jgi:hypothetical protein